MSSCRTPSAEPGGAGTWLDEGLEQRPQVLAGAVGLRLRDARLGVRVEHREVELVLGGVEVDEEVVDLVQDLAAARASERSILLITTTGGSRASSALRST